MNDLLFDVPWWIPTLLGVIGLVLLVRGNRRQHRRTRNAGAIVLLVAVAWALVSDLVDTPKEKCQKLTRQFVQSVVNRDWTHFDGLMEPGVTFQFVGSSWQISGRDELEQRVRAAAVQIGLKSATILDMEATQTDETVTITFKVFSRQEFSLDEPIASRWQFGWRLTNGQWRLHEINALEVSGATPEQVEHGLGAAPESAPRRAR